MVVNYEAMTIFLKVFLEADKISKSLFQALVLLLVVAIQYCSNKRELNGLKSGIADCLCSLQMAT